MAKELEGRVAIVTGGARGIGAACVRRLAEAGAAVIATDLRVETLKAHSDELRAEGHRILDVAHDVTSEEGWRNVVDETMRHFGRLDILVNNAGIGGTWPISEMTIEQWRMTMAVNSDGVFLGVHSVLPVMNKGTGSIINISSIMGFIAQPGAAAYCASKGAVRLFTKAAALEFAAEGRGIRVNSVHPGFIETPLLHESMQQTPEAETALQQLRALHPIGRLGASEEIADAVVFLASDRSSFMTGTEMVVDGGYTAR